MFFLKNIIFEISSLIKVLILNGFIMMKSFTSRLYNNL